MRAMRYAVSMRRAINVAIVAVASLFHFPAFAASPLELDCLAEQTLPGRALVCEYAMLGRMNAQLAELSGQAVLAGRAGSNQLKRWVSARDVCKDVECLDQALEAGIREAKLALVAVEDRQPAPILSNARGEVLRVLEKRGPPAAAPAPAQSFQPPVAREGRRLETYSGLILVAAVLAYAMVARRLSA